MALQNTSNPLQYQASVNGLVYGFTDITIQIGGTAVKIYEEISEINYTWTNVGRQKVTGTSPIGLGYTAGMLEFKGSFTISLEGDDMLMQQIIASNGGIAGVSRTLFDITLNYGPLPGTNKLGQARFQRDKLMGVLIDDGDQSHSNSAGLVVKHNFVFNNLSRNGLSMI